MSELIVVPGGKKKKRKNSATGRLTNQDFFSAQNYDDLIFLVGQIRTISCYFILLGWCYSYEKNLLTLYLCAIEN